MMKVHICPACGFYAITSRRNYCECKSCSVEMAKASVSIEDWWEYGKEERISYVRKFLKDLS